MKRTIIIVFLMMLVSIASADYTLPVEALTNSPADSVTNYLGNNPSAPSTLISNNTVYIPVSGTITMAEIYDYSGTAGTAQAYSYYIRVNNAKDYLIKTLSVSANERVFMNTSMNIVVNAGDYFEIKRVHPVWTTNPLTNIVGGYIYVNTSTPGYTLWGQGLTNSPADNVINYFGTKPGAPVTNAGRAKIYVPANGTITAINVRDYSGTAGTAESYGYRFNKNGGAAQFVQNLTAATNLRNFANYTESASVVKGDYIEFSRVHPAWVTNPLTNIVGATAFINMTGSLDPKGYLLHVQALTSSPTDGQTVYFGNLPKAPTTSAGISKVYIRNNGTIRRAEIYTYSGTAGTSESWSMYVRKNNTEDYLVSTIAAAVSERRFTNTSINISVTTGDYIEIKGIQPTWATNPATTIYGGYLWIEYPVPAPPDTTPPASITNIQADTGITTIYWSWTNPSDGDFNGTMVYQKGAFLKNVSKTTTYDNWVGLIEGNTYTLSTHTFDTTGNLNQTWMNKTVTILASSSPILEKQTPTTAISLSKADGAKVVYTNKIIGVNVSAMTMIDSVLIKPIYSSSTTDMASIGTGTTAATSPVIIDSQSFLNGTLKQTITLKEYHDVSYNLIIPKGYILNPMPDGSYMITDPSPEGKLGGIIIKTPVGWDSNVTGKKYVPMKFIVTGENTLALSFDNNILVHNLIEENKDISNVWANGTIQGTTFTDYPYYVPITYPLIIDPTYITTGQYTYSQNFTVNSTTALTNFPVKMILSNATGTSTTPGFYYTNGTTRTDWADVVWTNTSNAVLGYWYETGTNTATNSTWWINVPSIANDNTTQIILWFGNASQTTTYSDGLTTFDLFDDFNNGTTLDTSKWTLQKSGGGSSVDVASSIVTITAGAGDTDSKIYTKTNFTTGYILRTRAKTAHWSGTMYENIGFRSSVNSHMSLFFTSGAAYNRVLRNQNSTSSTTDVSTATWSANVFHIAEVTRRSDRSALQIDDNGTIFTNTVNYASGTDQPVYLDAAQTNAIVYADWVAVRKYIATEPFLTTISPAAGGSAPVASFTTAKSLYRIPGTLQVNDTSTNTPTVWNWSWGDGTWTNGTTQNATHKYTTRGTKSVLLVTSNANGANTTPTASKVRIVGYENLW